MKAHYDHQPARLEDVENGSHLWRWNIQPTEKTDPQTGAVHAGWECDEVTIWNHPTVDKVKKAVIAETWDTNIEVKLINDYNGAILKILPIEKKQPYTDFLTQMSILKTEIDAYFNTLI